MDKTTFSSLLDIGKTVASALVPGAAALIPIAERVIETIDHATETALADTQVELEQIRDELDTRIASINDHVDDVVDKLRGEG